MRRLVVGNWRRNKQKIAYKIATLVICKTRAFHILFIKGLTIPTTYHTHKIKKEYI